MFTDFQWVLFAVSSLVTFFCYQGIPNAIHSASIESTARSAKSGAFELFVRFCGTDHLVMLICMFSLSAGWAEPGGLASWMMVISAGAVAVVSFVSWLIIRRGNDG